MNTSPPSLQKLQQRPPQKPQQRQKIAIYWDFENIHAQITNLLIPGEYDRTRDQEQKALIRIQPVLNYAKRLGDVFIHKAYCDWRRFGNYQEQLNEAGMSLVQIFSRGWNGKNGADILMALDALLDMQRYPHITHFMILANDTDFIGLAQKLRHSGKGITGIGFANANRFWKSCCDRFLDYEKLSGLSGPGRDSADSPSDQDDGSLSAKEERMAKILFSSIKWLEGKKETGNYISIRGLWGLSKGRPEFSSIGSFERFRDFLIRLEEEEKSLLFVDEDEGGHIALADQAREDILKEMEKIMAGNEWRAVAPLSQLREALGKIYPSLGKPDKGFPGFLSFLGFFPDLAGRFFFWLPKDISGEKSGETAG